MIHDLERHPQHCCTSGVYHIGKDISCGVQQSNSHLCIVSKENKGGKEGRKGRKERKEGRKVGESLVAHVWGLKSQSSYKRK